MDPSLKLSCNVDTPTSEEDVCCLQAIPYRTLVGSLMYIAMGTHLDIAFAVQQLSQYLDCYSLTHWDAAKHVVRYLKGTQELWLQLGGSLVADLVGYTDSNYANCVDTRRSISGYSFSLGSGLVSWSACKQKTVSTSSCELEYVAACEATKEAVWLRALLLALNHAQIRATLLHCDNNGALILSGDPSFHARVKHIDIKFHYIQERVAVNEIEVKYINTKDNLADAFTKALPAKSFLSMRELMGVCT